MQRGNYAQDTTKRLARPLVAGRALAVDRRRVPAGPVVPAGAGQMDRRLRPCVGDDPGGPAQPGRHCDQQQLVLLYRTQSCQPAVVLPPGVAALPGQLAPGAGVRHGHRAGAVHGGLAVFCAQRRVGPRRFVDDRRPAVAVWPKLSGAGAVRRVLPGLYLVLSAGAGAHSARAARQPRPGLPPPARWRPSAAPTASNS